MRRRLGPGLAFRIYFVGLAQFAVVAAGLFAMFLASRPKLGPNQDEARFVIGELEGDLGDRAALDAALGRVDQLLRASAVVVDAKGNVVASTPEGRLPRCPSGGLTPPELAEQKMACTVGVVVFPDGSAGEVRFGSRGPPPPPHSGVIGLVLLVVGVSSWLLSRHLTHPLKRLSEAARAFGDGDLTARVALVRADELGEVARAFDEMADRLTEVLRAEKELLANVSHELRTPLARIRVAVDLASEGDAEVAREVLGDIASDLAELERLISDTLTAARLDLAGSSKTGGLPPLRLAHVNPRVVLERAAERFRLSHPERTLEVDLAADLPAIEADEVLLRRAFENLLENAHTYTDGPVQPVGLHASSTAGEIAIEIRDAGVGIAESDLPHVFRPFFRADRSRTRATGGLGLGLALTKRIVEAHGGSLTIESELHRGTTTRIRIPVLAG